MAVVKQTDSCGHDAGGSLLAKSVGILVSLSLVLLISVGQGCASAPPKEYAGRLLEMRLIHTEHTYGYAVTLVAAGPEKVPRLQFTGYDRQLLHEQPLYEKVMVYAGEDETNRSRMRREVVAGEVIEGAVQTREKQLGTGPLAGERVVINGKQVMLNGDGIYVDHEEMLLRLFDELRLKKVVLQLEHPRLGKKQLALDRATLQRSLGVDLHVERTVQPSVLTFAADAVTARPGQAFRLQVRAGNDGETPASSVMGRLISRHAWLDGVTFYFGNVAAASEKSFSRRIQVPAAVPPGRYFAELGTWELRGPNPQRNVLVEVRVEELTQP